LTNSPKVDSWAQTWTFFDKNACIKFCFYKRPLIVIIQLGCIVNRQYDVRNSKFTAPAYWSRDTGHALVAFNMG